MKVAMNLALAILLSLGLTACGSNGGNSGASVPPKMEKPIKPEGPENPNANPPVAIDADKDPQYIEVNDPNKTQFSFQKNSNDPKGSITLYESSEASTKLTIDNGPNDHFIANVFKPEQKSPVDKYDEVVLNATYRGFIFLQTFKENTKVDTRSLVLTLQDKYLTGHSVKTSQDDLQLIFEPAQVKVDENKQLGIRFSGYVNVVQGETKTKPETNLYSGYVLGEKGEEITGTLSVEDFQGGMNGVFITRKDKKLMVPPKNQ